MAKFEKASMVDSLSKNISLCDSFISASHNLSPKKDTQVARCDDAGRLSPAASVVHLEEIELMDMRSIIKDPNRQSESFNVCPMTPNKSKTSSNTECQFEDNENKIQQLIFDSTRVNDYEHASSNAHPMITLEPICKVSTRSEVGKSSLLVPGGSTKHISSRIQIRGSFRKGSIPKFEDDDDEDDICMASLTELLGAVRQYAKEIHEIYDPIKKDEEERIRKRNERIEKRKNSKDVIKSVIKKSENQPASPNQHEVRVDIHELEDKLREKVRSGTERKSRYETFPRENGRDLLSANPIASLYVENEKLSSTWPRGQRQSKSRERFWSDITLNKQNPGTSWSSGRPHIPAEWTSSLKDEKEKFEKTFRRLPKSNNLQAGSFCMASSLQQKILPRPRQVVAEIAKENQKIRDKALPTICIIPPLVEQRRLSVESHGGVLPSTSLNNDVSAVVCLTSTTDVRRSEAKIPAVMMFGDQCEERSQARQSKNGDSDVKSSSRVGLRRRKSVDQGLGQSVVSFEKY